MTRPKHKRPQPPKEWYPTGKELPKISGIAHDGSIVVHPTQFRKLVEAGVIDEKGRRL